MCVYKYTKYTCIYYVTLYYVNIIYHPEDVMVWKTENLYLIKYKCLTCDHVYLRNMNRALWNPTDKSHSAKHRFSVVLMETLINLILWWVTLISIGSDSQPDLEKKKTYINVIAAKLRYIIYIPKKKANRNIKSKL